MAGRPDPPPLFRAVRVFPDLKLEFPLYIIGEPQTNDPATAVERMFIIEQRGRIWQFARQADPVQPSLFLQLEDRDAYGMTFHPRYPRNLFVYVFSNGPNSDPVRRFNRISRFTVVRDALHACDPATEKIIIEWESNGHNGGDLAFGPDGFLYISSGDGTSDSDTNLTGQKISDLLSGMLRIDVDHPAPGQAYSIPKDNPFLDLPEARPELWAYGFRNPWRIHFDPHGNLWCGDIGQDQWEMLELVRKADNYGWSVVEGGEPFYLERERGPHPFTRPIIVHPHAEARSITGGTTYLGKKFPELAGCYLYGDYGTGKIWALRYQDGAVAWHREIADTPHQILGFGRDREGEIYYVDYGGNAVYTLEREPPAAAQQAFPRRLSETGLFASVAEHRVHEALVPYSVNAPLWSDGAHKDRFIALPGLSRIEYAHQGAWRFPEGAVLVKTFSFDLPDSTATRRQRVETRLLVFQQNEWTGYSYKWNEAQTDAELVEAAGADQTYQVADAGAQGGTRSLPWHFPSRAECMMCHSRAAGFVLGLNTLQMNRWPNAAPGQQPQLTTLEQLGLFQVNGADLSAAIIDRWRGLALSLRQPAQGLARLAELVGRPAAKGRPQPDAPRSDTAAGLAAGAAARPTAAGHLLRRLAGLPAAALARAQDRYQQAARRAGIPVNHLALDPRNLPHLVDPADELAPLELRVRSYLHANCAHCHVAAGGGNAAMELAFTTSLDKANLVGARPLHDRFGIDQALLVAPGAPERSLLLVRMARRGRGQMPPLASNLPDEAGLNLLSRWIEQLPAR